MQVRAASSEADGLPGSDCRSSIILEVVSGVLKDRVQYAFSGCLTVPRCS